MNSRKSDQDRWLTEAASALAEAERATGLLAMTRARDDLALAAVQAEIMGLRQEIERLRRERSAERRRDFDPDWINFSAWTPAR